MADPEGTEAGLIYDPVADAEARYPDWIVWHTTLGWGIREVLSRRSRVILLEAAGTAAEQRCSLAHAVAHLDLGHHPVPSAFFDVRQELAADTLAARRLIPIAALAGVLRWTRSQAEVAAELRVDRPTLTLRWRGLTRDEQLILIRDVPASVDAA